MGVAWFCVLAAPAPVQMYYHQPYADQISYFYLLSGNVCSASVIHRQCSLLALQKYKNSVVSVCEASGCDSQRYGSVGVYLYSAVRPVHGHAC